VADSPYPELKKSHTPAHLGTPWRDRKPPPSATVWNVIQGFGNYWLLVAAIDLRVFDTIGAGRSVTADALARELECPVAHLRQLLDGLVALGLLDQVRERYELNDTAERYLLSASDASMAELVRVAPGPHANWTGLADTVRNGRPDTPIDLDPVAFYAPLVRGTFTTQRRAAMFCARMLGVARLRGAPRLLDVGAGGAPWSISMLEAHPAMTAVVNDFDEVLSIARQQARNHGVDDRCEFRAGDFHDVTFEDDYYDLVALGHVCRTEGARGAAALITRAFAALRPGGRLLLADYFPDNTRKFNPFGVLMGVTMMASTVHGFTFTNEEFVGWLRAAGFVDIRMIEPIGFNHVYVARKPGR
jgi:ubiquinone/menaquinone biosynthesis C-methylase UbiE